jgi:hypothetical protein
MLTATAVGMAAEYVGDATPTVREEEVRWLLNRGRFDRAAENTLRKTAFTDVPVRSGPLAPHESLSRAAHRHSTDMATKNVMQHETVIGSAYYNRATQLWPWDRAKAEGYPSGWVFENVAAGYASAEQVYIGWWNSQGHRRNMYEPDLRELGTGHAYRAGTKYLNYWTMNVASADGAAFFTDTAFTDTNANGVYNQGEGVAGVVIILRVDGKTLGDWDRSSEVGSFAVPIDGLRPGAVARVGLRNDTNLQVTLSVPRSFAEMQKLTLAAGQELEYGSFTAGSTERNFGFRDLAALPAQPPQPTLVLKVVGVDIELSWNTSIGWNYRVQRSLNLDAWVDLTAAPMAGTGGTLRHVHSGAVAQSHGFYRLVVEPSS